MGNYDIPKVVHWNAEIWLRFRAALVISLNVDLPNAMDAASSVSANACQTGVKAINVGHVS